MRTKYMEYSVLLEQCTDSFRTKYTIIEILRCRVLFWVGFSSMHGMVRTGIPRVYFYFLLHGNEFRVVFSSAEWFGTEFREFASNLVPRNGIPSCVLFRRRVRNLTMGVCFYFCSTERNSELFPLPRKGSERNSEIFCSAEQPEFRRK
jgi:hypothetical protein